MSVYAEFIEPHQAGLIAIGTTPPAGGGSPKLSFFYGLLKELFLVL
jgi:hypothetical protein